jgi:hypothetical protein
MSRKFAEIANRSPSVKARKVKNISKNVKNPGTEPKDQRNQHHNTAVIKEKP